MIRKYLPEDRSWVKPIAQKYDEWETTDSILSNPELFGVVGIWVIPEKAIVGIFKDSLGNIITHRIVSWIPVAAVQTKIQDLEDSVCIPKCNQQEGT